MLDTNYYTFPGRAPVSYWFDSPQQQWLYRRDANPLPWLPTGAVSQIVSETVMVSGGGTYAPGTVMGDRGDGTYLPAVKGSVEPMAILAAQSDASAGDVAAGIYVHGQFVTSSVAFDSSFTQAEVITALQKRFIFLQQC